MEPLKRWFKLGDDLFLPGKKLGGISAFYLAVKSVIYFPKTPTRCAPHIRDSLDLKRFMTFVLIALIPATLFGIYNTGLQAHLAQGRAAGFIPLFLTGAGAVIPIILTTYGAGLFWEFLFATVRKDEISEGFLVSGLLFSLSLPPDIPLWQVAAGISFGIVIGKEVFGGTGRNLLNPALTGRAFLFFSYPASMSGPRVWIPGATQTAASGVDAVSQATPLALGSDTGYIVDHLHNAGYSLGELFLGFHPGSIGETSALMIFAGAGFLVATGIANYRIILGGILGLAVTAWIFNLSFGQTGGWVSAPPIYHLICGGFALGICFMATDPVSAPGTDKGRWFYGFCIGFLTVLIRGVNPAYVEGVMLTILFMNVFSPLIDHVTVTLETAGRIPNV